MFQAQVFSYLIDLYFHLFSAILVTNFCLTMFQAQVFSVWAARIGPTGDWYGWYMLICQYDPPYYVSVHRYALVCTIQMVGRYISMDWQGEPCFKF